MKTLKETFDEITEASIKHDKKYLSKLNDIDNRHRDELLSKGFDPYSKEASDLWKKSYKDEFIALKKEFNI